MTADQGVIWTPGRRPDSMDSVLRPICERDGAARSSGGGITAVMQRFCSSQMLFQRFITRACRFRYGFRYNWLSETMAWETS